MAKQRLFRTKTFSRWMTKSNLTDKDLRRAAEEMNQGLIDADLGRNILKKRISIGDRGKRSGARTIVATNFLDHWFFLYAFAKNEKSNIDKSELKYFQEVAKSLLELSNNQLDTLIKAKELMEIPHDIN